MDARDAPGTDARATEDPADEARSAMVRPVYFTHQERTCEMCEARIRPGRSIWTGARGTRMCSHCVFAAPA